MLFNPRLPFSIASREIGAMYGIIQRERDSRMIVTRNEYAVRFAANTARALPQYLILNGLHQFCSVIMYRRVIGPVKIPAVAGILEIPANRLVQGDEHCQMTRVHDVFVGDRIRKRFQMTPIELYVLVLVLLD